MCIKGVFSTQRENHNMTTKVLFKLPSAYVAEASHGILLGEFNNWNQEEGISLQKTEDGSMVAELYLTPGKTYEYRYLLNDGRWVNDDSNKKFTEVFGNVIENCVVEVPVSAVKKEKKTTTAKSPKKEKKQIVDNLTSIEGITKKIALLLNENGIITYKDLGKCTKKKLVAILEEAGINVKQNNPATWPKLAKAASEQ